MSKSSSAKRQKPATQNASRDEPRITDPRFANIQSDPRFRLPGRKNKVKLDKRFSRVLQDEDFTKRAKVDRYGRPLQNNAERSRLKRKYEFDEDDEDEDDEPDDDDKVQRELQRVDNSRDLLRQGRGSDASSVTSDDTDETTSSEDEEEEGAVDNEVTIGATTQSDIPMGEVTSRIAIVNLDWDNIRAADIMAVINSFLPANGSLLKVSIYPSEFGKERLEREEMEGPPKEIFAAKGNETDDNPDDDNDNEDDESEAESKIKDSLLAPDAGDEFDSAALRRYQLDRLRYYYCVLTFSSPSVADHVYSAVDGTEYLTTANFFDLRFVPDETDFSSDTPKEECTVIPDDYRPNDFVTDALQHSKVRLTWDADDGSRKDTIARAFRGGRKEIDENDLKAYLASDSSTDEEDDGADDPQVNGAGLTKKELERQKMRAALGLAPEPIKKSSSKGDKKEKAPVGDIQITFTSGFSAPTENDEDESSKKQRKTKSVFENSPEPDETTVEKYVRKERERKQRRKDKAKSNNNNHNQANDAADEPDQGNQSDQDQDLGFDDPFFASAANEPSAQEEKAASNRLRKEERLKKKKEREAEEEAEKKQRAELELLMVDDDADAGDGNPGRKIRHFDMKEIERAEKLARKKGRSKNKKPKGGKATDADDAEDAFKVDTSDPRFARLFDSHEYAIDPTNPRFKATKGMREVLDEGRRRRDREHESKTKQAAVPEELQSGAGARGKDGKKKNKASVSEVGKYVPLDGGAEDVKDLVAKIKSRNK